MNAIHYVTIPVKVEVDADHQEDTVPLAEAVWVRLPEGARTPIKIDRAGRKWIDIHDLVIVDGQREAWDAVEAEMKDADAGVLDSEPYPNHMEPA